MFYTIYKVTNIKSGKEYIGKHQTKDLSDGYMGSGKYLKCAIDKYGAENFRKEILYVFDTEEEMNSKESELVTEEYCARDDTYNLCPGGKGGFGYLNRQYWDESRRKDHNKTISPFRLSEFRKKHKKVYSSNGKKLHEAMRKKYPKSGFFGKNHTEEWKKNHSETMKEKQKGVKNSQYGTIWITNGTENKKMKKNLPLPEGWRKGRSALAT